ncbi:hypothetical protein [Pseudomonas aeruginosa]|uniref:hypothetical protein n=1 Tax=Pseudomonas aeruginosa TaxID=287 RepID=UPI001298653C|nr:hypothetical protein [Pseudomonas aeruginosa]
MPKLIFAIFLSAFPQSRSLGLRAKLALIKEKTTTIPTNKIVARKSTKTENGLLPTSKEPMLNISKACDEHHSLINKQKTQWKIRLSKQVAKPSAPKNNPTENSNKI